MAQKVLVALDQGTTSSRPVVFDTAGRMLAAHGVEFPQIFPKPGWVEHDPHDILETQTTALRQAVKLSGVDVADIAAIGITNQRETTLLWDRETGECVHNAIVWQCRRTAHYVEKLMAQGHGDTIREKTGLIPDAYFSGTKLAWLLDRLDLHERAERGELCFGTVDSFLAWHLVTGRPHVTDATNAGRTMLFNLKTQDWDDELLNIMDIPRACLPQVVDTAQVIGTLDPAILGRPIPVAAMAGDQHASLFGQACLHPGMVKNTYGTGCFMLMNTGEELISSRSGLLSTMAWRIGGKPTYALEGSVFMGGATIQWLRDEMKLIATAAESEGMAKSVKDTGGVYLVPAFTGLGAPWWQNGRRASIQGMSRKTNGNHIVRAALESVAYRVRDVVGAMEREMGMPCKTLRADGGMTANHFLMQFQSDILQIPVSTGTEAEVTALGAAYMAGLAGGVWRDAAELAGFVAEAKRFYPQISAVAADELYDGWLEAIGISATEIT